MILCACCASLDAVCLVFAILLVFVTHTNKWIWMIKYILRKYKLLTDTAYKHGSHLPRYKKTIHHQCFNCYLSQMMATQSLKHQTMRDFEYLMLAILEQKGRTYLMKFSVDQNKQIDDITLVGMMQVGVETDGASSESLRVCGDNGGSGEAMKGCSSSFLSSSCIVTPKWCQC